MKTCPIVLLLLLGATAASAAPDEEPGPHRKINGTYWIYGGGLGDPVPPTEGSGIRVRARDKDRLFCMRWAKGEYSCNFGFDLRSGKSIGGIVC